MSSTPGSTRRGFLLFGGASAVAVAAVTSKLTATMPPIENQAANHACDLSLSDNHCLQNFSLADFQSLVGQVFEVQGFLSSSHLKLVSVISHRRPADKRPPDSRQEPFSLQFAAKNGVNIRSEIQDFFHPVMGSFKVLVNQIGNAQANQPQYYEVVFG
ncbi:DUF6916 family protein [Undibacterium flavidum]|uniref:DUF6916 domain-containing protein n=1 Tax=Undibacterium flavidum TaxID=2762297 RepID=A0ABR6YAQ2_9BURK|nr:hypothetical protein [Undibacterium flavidum]MBC3873668.1 hypothetical protein [Undibacterium flavidum]